MSKSIKFKNDTYIDTTGITHNRELLSTLMIVTGTSGRSKNISYTDVNTIRANGFYYGNGVTNAPTQYGYLFVISHFSASNYCYQVWFNQGSILIYAREIINGTPNTWKQFTLT